MASQRTKVLSPNEDDNVIFISSPLKENWERVRPVCVPRRAHSLFSYSYAASVLVLRIFHYIFQHFRCYLKFNMFFLYTVAALKNGKLSKSELIEFGSQIIPFWSLIFKYRLVRVQQES